MVSSLVARTAVLAFSMDPPPLPPLLCLFQAYNSAVEAVCLRRCIHFVVADAMGRRLGQQGRADTLNVSLSLPLPTAV